MTNLVFFNNKLLYAKASAEENKPYIRAVKCQSSF